MTRHEAKLAHGAGLLSRERQREFLQILFWTRWNGCKRIDTANTLQPAAASNYSECPMHESLSLVVRIFHYERYRTAVPVFSRAIPSAHGRSEPVPKPDTAPEIAQRDDVCHRRD